MNKMNSAERRKQKRVQDKNDSFMAKLVILGFKKHRRSTEVYSFSSNYTIGNIKERNNIFVQVHHMTDHVYLYINDKMFGGTWNQEPALNQIVGMLNDPESMHSNIKSDGI